MDPGPPPSQCQKFIADVCGGKNFFQCTDCLNGHGLQLKGLGCSGTDMVKGCVDEQLSMCTDAVEQVCGGITTMDGCNNCVGAVQSVLRNKGCPTDDIPIACERVSSMDRRGENWKDSKIVRGKLTVHNNIVFQPCSFESAQKDTCTNMFLCASEWNLDVKDDTAIATCSGPGATQKITFDEMNCILNNGVDADGNVCAFPTPAIPMT